MRLSIGWWDSRHIERLREERDVSMRLREIADEIRNTYVPNSQDDLPYIGLEHVEQKTLQISAIGSSQEVESHKFRFTAGDILFGTLRPYFRKVVIAPCNGVCSTEFCVVRPKNANDLYFVFYTMAHPHFIKHATSNSKGARPRTKWKLFSDYKLPVFPPVQRWNIGQILFAYDNLIENNRRRIQLLEQAARLLYKEWFVHFRFPGHEHTKITNGIPDGWSKKPLSEIANVTMGQSPKSIYYNQNGEGLPFHQGVTNFGDRFPAHETYCTVENRIAELGDILFSVRAPVGRINIAPTKIVIGRGLAAIRSEYGSQNLLFYALKSHFFKEDMIGGGAIFAAIAKKDIHNIELLQPAETIVQTFTNHIKPIDEQIENLWRHNLALTEARDLLLPRSMNGEITI